MIVLLASRGNPDVGQDPNRSLPGVRAYRAEVPTLQEASEACRSYIKRHNLGGGNWFGGQVYDATGTWIASVSYNGRVWRAGPYPQPEIVGDDLTKGALAMSGGVLMPGDLDAALCGMVREAEKTIRAWIVDGNGHFEISDVDWDSPAHIPTGSDFEKGAEASHAIGFICGVAAALDITPMSLLESYEERKHTMAVAVPPLPSRGLTTRELMRVQGFTKPRAKRPTSQRRQKIQIPKK